MRYGENVLAGLNCGISSYLVFGYLGKVITNKPRLILMLFPTSFLKAHLPL